MVDVRVVVCCVAETHVDFGPFDSHKVVSVHKRVVDSHSIEGNADHPALDIVQVLEPGVRGQSLSISIVFVTQERGCFIGVVDIGFVDGVVVLHISVKANFPVNIGFHYKVFFCSSGCCRGKGPEAVGRQGICSDADPDVVAGVDSA